MPDENARAQIGDNNPPPYRPDMVADLQTKAKEFAEAAGEWLNLGEIETEAKAEELNDFLSGLRSRIKETDAARKEDKRPHDDAGKAVQSAYAPIIDMLKMAMERVTPMQTAWLKKVRDQQAAEAQRKAEEARKAQEAAERQAAAAQSKNDIAGAATAEAAQKRTAELQKQAADASKAKVNVGSATGAGRTASLRKTVLAEVTNPRVAFMHYQDAPEIIECLRTLALRDARSKGFTVGKDSIPGIEITVEEKAI